MGAEKARVLEYNYIYIYKSIYVYMHINIRGDRMLTEA